MAFRFLTAGESHGPALGAIVEGLPAGVPVSEELIARDLARRQGGYGRGARMRIEQDRARIKGGVRHGRTLGSPVFLEVENRDWANWTEVMAVEEPSAEARAALEQRARDGDRKARPVTRVRPGHADLAGALKYATSDVRDILERASARETTMRVAAGALCRSFLRALGIDVWSFTAELGDVAIDPERATRTREETEASPLRCPDPDAEGRMIEAVDEARRAGDTLGGVFEVVATGVPLGLGSHVHWDRKLDGALAAAICSIHAVKGVEFGHAFAQARQRGSAVHDVIEGVGDEPGPAGTESVRRWLHRTNRAAGLTGGITNGEPIVVRGAVKPISTLARPLPSADLRTGRSVETAHYERSDIAVVPAAGVIGEAMVLLTLTRFLLEKTGGDSLGEVSDNLSRYRARTLAVADEVVEGGVFEDAGGGEGDDRQPGTGGDG